jgi:hypothetical protein
MSLGSRRYFVQWSHDLIKTGLTPDSVTFRARLLGLEWTQFKANLPVYVVWGMCCALLRMGLFLSAATPASSVECLFLVGTPRYAHKGDFLSKFSGGCQAVVLKGGTGIGKSVAVPQVRERGVNIPFVLQFGLAPCEALYLCSGWRTMSCATWTLVCRNLAAWR